MRAVGVALLSLFGGAFAGGGCGLADVYADSAAFSGGTCFGDGASQISPLDESYRQLLLANEGGGVMRMLVKEWDTHKLNSAIAYILIHEIIGYPKPQMCTTANGYTSGSFDLLSGTPGRPAEADIDMELWASSAYPEYLSNEGSYSNAGTTFSYGRSGLFLRPGGSDEQRAKLLSHGRMYNNLERDVLPTLPTLRQARALTQWCNIGGSDHCMEVPNRACHDLGESEELGSGSAHEYCRVLIKASDSADKGIVEEIIQNASLPLVIVYTGSGPSVQGGYLKELSNQSFLFYHWEPALVISPDTDIMRIVFEDPVMCEPNETFVSLPPNKACDFRQGLVHKGYSTRLGRMYPEVAHFVQNYAVPTAEIWKLEQRKSLEEGATHFGLACEWLKDNEELWKGWMKNPEPSPQWKQVVPTLLIVIVGLLAAIWATLPMLPARMGGGQWAWFKTSQWFKPTAFWRLFFSGSYRFVIVLFLLPTKFKKLIGDVTERLFHHGRRAGSLAERSLHNLEAAIQAPKQPRKKRFAIDHPEQAKSHSLLARVARDAETYASKEYHPRTGVAVSFLQEYIRTGSMARAYEARADAKERVRCGIQFAMRVVHGMEGDDHFQVGVMRGKEHQDTKCTLKIQPGDGGLSELAPDVDYVLLSDEVVFQPGERFASVTMRLLPQEISMEANLQHGWLPKREMLLSLQPIDPTDRLKLGDATQCRIVIVDKDVWPGVKDVQLGHQSVYSAYVQKIFFSNFEKEMWWLVGVIFRTINSKIVKNILVMMLFDLAIAHRSLDWSFIVAAVYLFTEVVEHLTGYWYNSAGAMGYNMSLVWVLSKWTQLPLGKIVDVDTIGKYRGMVELITSAFFGKNDYSVFADLVSTWVNIICIIIAPLILFNLDFARALADGVPWAKKTSSLSIIMACSTVAFVIVFILLSDLSPGTYEVEVRRWITLERKLTLDLHSMLEDTPTYRLYQKSLDELLGVIKCMNAARGQRFSYLVALDASGRGYDWTLTFVYIAAMMVSPILYGILGLTIGQLQALFSIIVSNQAIISTLSSGKERLRIAQYLIGQLAEILNEDREHLRRQVEICFQQYIALSRTVKDLDQGADEMNISLYNVRYTSYTLRDVTGVLLHMNIEGQLATGALSGLRSPFGDDPASQQLKLEHRVIIDLLAGARVPSDGCVVYAPHLTVGLVTNEPIFLGGMSLRENIMYGCERPVADAVLWHLCNTLGLPRHLFNPHGGAMGMGGVSLTPIERQLLSVARTLITQPDVLIVHDMGALEPSVALRLGNVFKRYVKGYTLTRLGAKTFSMQTVLQNVSDKTDADAMPSRDQSSAAQRPNTLVKGHSDWSSTASMMSKDELASTEKSKEQAEAASRLSQPQGLTSIKGNSRRRRETAHKKEKGTDHLDVAEDLETRSSDRRTVIWHAMGGVLDQAGVKRRFFHKDGRLCRHRREGEVRPTPLASPGRHLDLTSGGDGDDGNESASEASKSTKKSGRRRSRTPAAASGLAMAGGMATADGVATAGGVDDAETARAAQVIQRRIRSATPPVGAAGSGEERAGEVSRGSV